VQAEREGGALRGAIDAGLALPWDRAWRPFGRACSWVMGLPFWAVFAVLLVGQWAVVAIVGSAAGHNGFSYYSGGDDSWYYTSAWVLGHGHIPYASIGYGVPLLLSPLAAIAGPSLVAGLPFAIALNMLVLWPVALLAVYGIARTIAGRGYAYLVTATWVVFPLATIPFFYERYHDRLVGQALPQALGLVATGDFPSMVALLVAAYFALRAISTGDRTAAIVGGLATGFALGVKPSNLIFVAAPLAALAVARRWPQLGLFAAGLAPALLALGLWKERGLGSIPAFSRSAVALAAGTSTPPLASLSVHHYVHLNWGHLRDNMYYLREYARSLRMVTWVLVAGVIALWRRSAGFAILFGGWLALFIVLKGTSTGVNVSDGSFFRLMIPAFPPFFFEIVALPLLVPVLGRRLTAAGREAASVPETPRARTVTLWAAGALTALPVLLFAVLPPLASATAATVPSLDQYVPANSFPLTATTRPGGTVVLRWPSQDAARARIGYVVFREPWEGLQCVAAAHGRRTCTFYSDPRSFMRILNPTALTPRTSYHDRPGPGHWIYRVAATVGLRGPTKWGNFMALSTRADAHVRG
jgi:hypothetical protein